MQSAVGVIGNVLLQVCWEISSEQVEFPELSSSIANMNQLLYFLLLYSSKPP